jgi:hypothetical protein
LARREPGISSGLCDFLHASMPNKAKLSIPWCFCARSSFGKGAEWIHELRLDGYRSLPIKTGAKVQLYSCNDNDFNARYPGIVKTLTSMPNETVINGEVAGLGLTARRRYGALPRSGSHSPWCGGQSPVTGLPTGLLRERKRQ